MYERYINSGKHRGVQIFKSRRMITGSDLKQLKNGQWRDCQPEYEYAYQFAGSYPYDTKSECIAGIDGIYAMSCALDIPIDETWVNAMNKE